MCTSQVGRTKRTELDLNKASTPGDKAASRASFPLSSSLCLAYSVPMEVVEVRANFDPEHCVTACSSVGFGVMEADKTTVCTNQYGRTMRSNNVSVGDRLSLRRLASCANAGSLPRSVATPAIDDIHRFCWPERTSSVFPRRFDLDEKKARDTHS